MRQYQMADCMCNWSPRRRKERRSVRKKIYMEKTMLEILWKHKVTDPGNLANPTAG